VIHTRRGRYDTLAKRLWRKVDKSGPFPERRSLGRCWVWSGSKNGGYGHIGLGARMEKTHRVAWFLSHGKWPEPCALHRCDNPACVRPSHLFEGTKAANNADRHRKGRTVVPGLRGEAHGMCRVPYSVVLKVRRAADVDPTELAVRFGVSVQWVHDVRRFRYRVSA
jgi:hypothetical protein